MRQPHADRGLVEADLGGSVGTDAGVAGEGEQRAGSERVTGDRDHHRLRVAADAHEDPPSGADEGPGALDACRHLGEVEAEIGRAACRARRLKYVSVTGGVGKITETTKTHTENKT